MRFRPVSCCILPAPHACANQEQTLSQEPPCLATPRDMARCLPGFYITLHFVILPLHSGCTIELQDENDRGDERDDNQGI